MLFIKRRVQDLYKNYVSMFPNDYAVWIHTSEHDENKLNMKAIIFSYLKWIQTFKSINTDICKDGWWSSIEQPLYLKVNWICESDHKK